MTVAAVLACEMLEDETRLALSRAYPDAAHPPLVWIESSLRERPAKLQSALEEVVCTLDAGARAGESVAVSSVRPGQAQPPADGNWAGWNLRAISSLASGTAAAG